MISKSNAVKRHTREPPDANYSIYIYTCVELYLLVQHSVLSCVPETLSDASVCVRRKHHFACPGEKEEQEEDKKVKRQERKEKEEMRRRGARFLLSRERGAMGKGSSNDPEFGVIRLGGCLDVN